MTSVHRVDVACISSDQRFQMRPHLDPDIVDDHTRIMVEAAEQAVPPFPPEWPFSTPVRLYNLRDDHDKYLCADGFHRLAGATKAGWDWVAAEIIEGSPTDAMMFACGANASHGLPRSNDTKKNAVVAALSDPEIGKYSSRRIAEICKVGNRFVGDVRKDLATVSGTQLTDTRIGADGRERHLPARPVHMGQPVEHRANTKGKAASESSGHMTCQKSGGKPTKEQAEEEAAKEAGLGSSATAQRALDTIDSIEQVLASETTGPVSWPDSGQDDQGTVRTFSMSDASAFRRAIATLIRTVDRGIEMELISRQDHKRVISELKTFGHDWAQLLPNQEWLG